MIGSYILGTVFRVITGLKFELLFWSFDCLPTKETEVNFALSGKTRFELLLLMASANCWESTVADSFTSLRGSLSVPFYQFLRIIGVVTLLNWNFPMFSILPNFYFILVILGWLL